MTASSAPERHGKALETTALVVADAGVHQRDYVGEIPVYAFLLVEVVGDPCLFAGERLKRFFAPGVGQAAGIKDETAAVPGLVLG